MTIGLFGAFRNLRLSAGFRVWLLAASIGCFCAVVAVTISGLPLLSLCVFLVATALARTSLEARRLAREKTDGELVPQIMDSLSMSIASGTSLIEAFDNLLLEAQPSIRSKAEKLLSIFESDVSLEAKVDASKFILNSREGDLFLELVLIASRRGDDGFTESLKVLSQTFRSQQNLTRELAAKQDWVLATARLGLASPWIVVLLLSVRPETALAFESNLGATVLLAGLAISFGAHRLIGAGAKVAQSNRNLAADLSARSFS
ncbi:MAG: type II secretion system F family protein [Micrococcales bacterium]